MSIYPPFTADQLHHLPDVLSAPRFATYLQARAGDRADALALYRWNLEVSAAFLVPLHVLEVTLRNAIVDAIEGVHGGTWPWSAGFIRSLPNPPAPNYSPTRDLQVLSRQHQTSGKIIADLKFVFWERMLTSRHQGRIWDRAFYIVFPNSLQTLGGSSQARSELREDIEEIRKLRNRIAHHEPIFMRPIYDDLDAIYRAVSWRSATAADWLAEIDPVRVYYSRYPKACINLDFCTCRFALFRRVLWFWC